MFAAHIVAMSEVVGAPTAPSTPGARVPGGDYSVQAHLARAAQWKRPSTAPVLPSAPTLSPPAQAAWTLYEEIAAGKASGSGFGPAALTWSDLVAYESVVGVPVGGVGAHFVLHIDRALRAPKSAPTEGGA